MTPRTVTLALVLLLALPLLPPGSAQPASGDWVVDRDTVLHGGSHTVAGDLRVTNGTLRLEGVALAVGGRIDVARGARLVLAPGDGAATQLAPAAGNRKFWINVTGSLEASGTPGAQITGVSPVLSPTGLDPIFTGIGGIQIAGNATLDGLIFHDSWAGLYVGPRGHATVRNALLQNLGNATLIANGQLTLSSSRLLGGRVFGLVGRANCNLVATDTVVEAILNTALVSGCPGTLRGMTFQGGLAGLTINGAPVTVRDSLFTKYTQTGASVSDLLRPDGTASSPPVLIANCTFEPAKGALNGIVASHALQVDVEGGSITGNYGDAIVVDTARIRVNHTVLHNNLGYGISLAHAALLGPPIPDADFGSLSAGTANRQGAIAQRVALQAQFVTAAGLPRAGLNLTIRDGSGRVVLQKEDANNATLAVRFAAYGPGPDGAPLFLGPFSYEARHPLLAAAQTGTVDPSASSLVVKGAAPAEGFHLSVGEALQLGAFLIGGGLILYAVLAAVVRRLRSRRT